MTLRGAVIGCGFFSDNHLNAWRDTPGAEIVAVCDLDKKKAEKTAHRFGVRAFYDSAEDLLAMEGLDFVDIVTTVESHRALVELAARRNLPIICQKPFATSLEEAVAMVDLCEGRNLRLMVHENFRWQKPLSAISQTIAEGEIGTPFFGRISFRHDYDSYARQPYLAEAERFIILDLGIHLLDLARVYFGEVTRLTCTTQRINPQIRGEDVATILLEHVNGASSVVDCSFSSQVRPSPFPQTTVEIDGSRGTIRLFPGDRMLVVRDGELEERDVAPRLRSWMARPWHVIQDSVLNIQRHWIECLQGRAEPATSGADNIKTLRLAFAAYQSAASGRTVEISDR